MAGLKIKGSGHYLPPHRVSALEMSEKLGVSLDWLSKCAGVEYRYFAGEETIASMGAKAITLAMEKAQITPQEVDLLIAAGSTPDQPVPHNSAFIHQELKFPPHVTPFDVDGTCLSFVHALIVAKGLLLTGHYRNIVIVSSEKPSVGLNYRWAESAALFGDGAVALVVAADEGAKEKGPLAWDFATYSEAVHLAEIPAGGTRYPTRSMDSVANEQFLFKMEGLHIYKKASQYLPDFFKGFLQRQNLTLDDFKMVVPHQASVLALNLMRDKLRISKDKFHINVQKYGNLVAASIPMGLHELMENKTLVTGDKVLFLSTAAGLTIGAMVFEL